MGTTQTAIARLERGEQSPSIITVQNYARAAGFCLEISFVRASENEGKTGCIVIVDNSPGGAVEIPAIARPKDRSAR